MTAVPAWLEDPYVISMLVPEVRELAPDATFARMMDQIVAIPPPGRPMTYDPLPRDDPRFVEAVDAAFRYAVQSMPLDVYTVTLRDRAQGVLEVLYLETGLRRVLHVRVAILREKEKA